MDTRTPTRSHDQRVGRLGEDLADAHLRGLGWQIIERNWRCREGELDIIARDPDPASRGTLVFVEVKYRSGLGFGDPLEAVTRAKVAKLRQLGLTWLRQQRDRGRPPLSEDIRIDAIGVLRRAGQPHEVTHVRGITR